jgi:hypothetical protein
VSQVCQVNGVDLMSSPYKVMDGWEMPEARLNAFGRSAQLAGAYPYESHYDDAPWLLPVLVSYTTSTLRDTYIDALTAAFTTPNAEILFGEKVAQKGFIIDADCAGNVEIDSTSCLVTFSGTRKPAWETTSSSFSGTVTNGWGTLSLGTPGGEIAAKMSLTLTCAAASTLFAAGVKPAPTDDFDPIDDYSGQSVAGAFGGEFSADASLSGTAAALGTAPTVKVAPNRGQSLAIARVRHTATAAASTRFQVGSAIGSSTRWQASTAATVANNTEVAVLGSVRVPSYELPTGTAEYGAAATDWNQTTHDSTASNGSWYYTFTVNGDRLHSFTLYASGTIVADDLFIFDGQGTDGTVLWSTGPRSLTEGAATYVCDIPVTDGQSLTLGNVRGFRYKNTSANAGFFCDGEVASVLTSDLYLVTTTQDKLSFDASTPVQATCSESSKYGAIDVLARVPLDWGGFAVKGSFGSGTGVTYSPDLHAFYPCDSNGAASGVALSPTQAPTPELACVAGVANTLVVATGAVANVTVSGTITERRIHRG